MEAASTHAEFSSSLLLHVLIHACRLTASVVAVLSVDVCQNAPSLCFVHKFRALAVSSMHFLIILSIHFLYYCRDTLSPFAST